MTAAWSIVVHRDGQPVTGPVPITRWEAAGMLAHLVVGLLGGPVSVAAAVLNDPDDHDLHVSAAPCDTCETRQQCRDAGRCLVPAGEAALAAEPAPQLDIFDALTTTGSDDDPHDDDAGVTFTSSTGTKTTVLWAESEMATKASTTSTTTANDEGDPTS